MENIIESVKQSSVPNHCKNTMLAYDGHVCDELFQDIISLCEEKLQFHNLSRTTRKKLFKVVVEMIQNTYHHADQVNDAGKPLKKVSFLLEYHSGFFMVYTCNKIKSNKIELLKNRIDAVNEMTPDEIKAYYRKRLSEGSLSKKGGAGLGIIDIVRKSNSSLNYEFLSADNLQSFVCLWVSVPA